MEKARLFDQVKLASMELEVKVQEATAELAHQNELLRRQALELEQASALKTQFLANMSHEFRTPLNAILGYTHMLLVGVGGGVNDSQRNALARIDSNSRHLLSLINEILDISRIEAGRMPVQVDNVDLRELFGEVLLELDPIIQRSKLRVATEIDQKLPTIRSDRQKVKQIVLNLLSNALKFTHDGHVELRARAAGRKRVTIEVSDTGIGIAPEDQQTVFEDFRQLDHSASRGYGGTGLGLSICRRLSEMLDGRVTLESSLGAGSTFTVHLPIVLRKG
jgi:signal transduction histidine kinase